MPIAGYPTTLICLLCLIACNEDPAKHVDADAPEIRITNDPSAPAVTLKEADVRDQYPWDYNQLCTNLKNRYKDFVCNKKFHEIKKPLIGDPRFSMRRLLDPSRPKGLKKDFYSQNILQVFDMHYRRRN